MLNKKSQVTAIVLLVLGILLIVGGYFIFEVKFKEKKEESSVSKVSQISTQEYHQKQNFFVYDLQSCLDSLVKEGIKNSFNYVLNKKALSKIDGLPVVFNGKNKVLVDFKDIKNYVENYVYQNFDKCKALVFSRYYQTRGVYVYPKLEVFDLYLNSWYAKISYKIIDKKNDATFEGEKDIEEKTSDLKDLLTIYNGLINYEAKTRGMEYNLFAFIYHPFLYSGYLGYPSTNFIIGCRKMELDLDKAKKDILNVLSMIIAKYKVDNTRNSIDTPQVFRIPYLKEFLLNAEVSFSLIKDKTKIDFSVVPGSSAYIRGNRLIVDSDPSASLSPSQRNLPICSYDLFYDIVAPVLVEIKYKDFKIPFVMELLINNNVPFNGSIEEMKKDNSNNPNPYLPETYTLCEQNKTILKTYGKRVKVLLHNQPVKDAIVKIGDSPCNYKTDDTGTAYIMPTCIGCPIFAIKDNYVSDVVYNDIRKQYILHLYETLDLHLWTIYTPDWLINNWGNESFTNLLFQGKDPDNFEDQTIDVLKFNAKTNVPNMFKNITTGVRLNLKVTLAYTGEKLNLSNASYMTNGVTLLKNVPYEVYYYNLTNNIDMGQYTFDTKNWFYDDKNKRLIPCDLKLYEFKRPNELKVGKEVLLIKLSNNKVIEFPYYDGIFNVENQKVVLTKKYLFFCLPRGVSIENKVYKYTYDNHDKKWKKTNSYSFTSIFKPLN